MQNIVLNSVPASHREACSVKLQSFLFIKGNRNPSLLLFIPSLGSSARTFAVPTCLDVGFRFGHSSFGNRFFAFGHELTELTLLDKVHISAEAPA